MPLVNAASQCGWKHYEQKKDTTRNPCRILHETTRQFSLNHAILLTITVQVVTEEAAIPFAVVTGREEQYNDYEGIAMYLLQVGRTVY